MTQSRMTKQRALILDTLRSVDTHPTADEIYALVREHMPRISLGTVYRNLEVLENQGQVLCLGQAGCQKRFDGNVVPHQHALCTSCGKIGDVPHPLPVPCFRADAVPGFTIDSLALLFYGTCDACAKQGDSGNIDN